MSSTQIGKLTLKQVFKLPSLLQLSLCFLSLITWYLPSFAIETDSTALNATTASQCLKPNDSFYSGNTLHIYSFDQKTIQDLRKAPNCTQLADGFHKIDNNGIVTKKWKCKGNLAQGNVEYQDPGYGEIWAVQKFEAGVATDRLFLRDLDEFIRLSFKNDKLSQICGSQKYHARILERANKDKVRRASRIKRYLAPSISFGTSDRFSGGLMFAPSFTFGDIGGAGYFLEAEYLRFENRNFMRLSSGFGFSAFFYSAFAAVGIRTEKSSVQSTDLTIGAGLTAVNFYLRPIYDHSTSKFQYDLGIKLSFPFFEL